MSRVSGVLHAGAAVVYRAVHTRSDAPLASCIRSLPPSHPHHPSHPSHRHPAKQGPRAIMVMRPRGWHLWEHQLPTHHYPHTAPLTRRAPPPPQSHLECRLWNDVFVDAQKELGIPKGGWGWGGWVGRQGRPQAYACTKERVQQLQVHLAARAA